MYKLLPKQEVNKVRREYSLRRISIMLALLCSAILFTAVALLPSFIFAREKMLATIFNLNSVGTVRQPTDTSALDTWLAKTNNNIVSVTPEIPTDEPYEYFQKIISKKSSDILITGLNWTRQNNGSKSLKVTGIAKSRQSALDFQSKLSESRDWSQVDLPVAVIAKEADISFEVTLIPAKPK